MSPRVLAVTSDGAPGSVITPILAALEASGLEVVAVDVGRAGSSGDGAMGRFVRAIAGEFADRRLERLLHEEPADVTLAFEPATIRSLTAIRDASGRPAPVVAVVGDLAPEPGWAGTTADRYLAVDDHAAVALADRGIPGERVIPVGPMVTHAFVQAASRPRSALRERFKITSGAVVLVRVAGLGYELTQQIALQLSLVEREATYIFDAGDDSEAATALRRQVPTLELSAKLFGRASDAPVYWRAADVVVARPSLASASRALCLGARFVALLDDQKRDERRASAVARRQLGAVASSPLLLSSSLETALQQSGTALEGLDGAGNVADITFLIGSQREEVLREGRAEARASTRQRVDSAAAYAEAREREAKAAGDLEDLSGGLGDLGEHGDGPAGADPVARTELDELASELRQRMTQVERIALDAQGRAARADKLAAAKNKAGDESGASAATRTADAERTRMHEALRELAELQQELSTLASARAAAPDAAGSSGASAGSSRARTRSRRGGGTGTRAPRQSVDDLLDQLKREAARGGASSGATGAGSSAKTGGGRSKKSSTRGRAPGSSVDDELAALKRKMQNQKRRK